MAASTPIIDIESDVFALRLATLLRSTRVAHGRSLRALARASDGRYTPDQLRVVEAGGPALSEEQVEALSALYGADLGTILPSRLPVAITGGVISAGGVTATFVATNSTSLLTAYLRLIRAMRRQKKAPMIVLRRDDIDVIADYLDESGEVVLDRLTALMGVTLTQRTAMATMFATGAIVIGLAGSSAARAPETASSPVPRSNDRTIEVVADTPTSDFVPITATATGDVARPAGGEDAAGVGAELETAPPNSTVPVTDSPSVTAAARGQSTTTPAVVAPPTLAPATVSTPEPSTTAVAGSVPAPTVVDTGGVVIPDLPYGDAIVIDDTGTPATTPVPGNSGAPGSATGAPPPVVVPDTAPAVPPNVATGVPPVPPNVATGAPPVPGSLVAPIEPVVVP